MTKLVTVQIIQLRVVYPRPESKDRCRKTLFTLLKEYLLFCGHPCYQAEARVCPARSGRVCKSDYPGFSVRKICLSTSVTRPGRTKPSASLREASARRDPKDG